MRYYMTSLEKTVESIYNRVGIDEPNIPVDEIARKLGIELFYGKKTFRIDNIICLDSKLSKEKIKEVFSHELCHCLYHVGNQLDMYELYRQYQEFKADNFAMHFCIPTFMLQKTIIPKQKYHAATFLADLFCVTNEFAFNRIEHYERQLFAAQFHQRISMCAENRTNYSTAYKVNKSSFK